MRKMFFQVLLFLVIATTFSDSLYADSISSPELFKPLLLDFPQIRDFAPSPSGNEIFFSVTSYRNELSFILFISKTNNGWSAPKIASFSGKYNDIEPAFSPDGNRIYFSSQRPLTDSLTKPKDYDIWYVERNGEGWSAPVNLGEPVNTAENEFYPSVANSGNIYFTSKREDARGGEDIYVSFFKSGRYSEPINLGDSINSKKFEFNAFVAPDESYIVFSSFGRSDGIGGGDLYISQKNIQGNWGTSKNMGSSINSKSLDYCPFIDIDNKVLYFTSRKNSFPEYFEKPIDLKELIKILEQPENGLDKVYWIGFDINKY